MVKITHKNIIICSIIYSIILYNKCVDIEKQSKMSLWGWAAEEFKDPSFKLPVFLIKFVTSFKVLLWLDKWGPINLTH